MVKSKRSASVKDSPLPVPEAYALREKLTPGELRRVLRDWRNAVRPRYTVEVLSDEADDHTDDADLGADLRASRRRNPIFVTDDETAPRFAAARLKWLAFQLGLTQKEIARRVGVSPVVINRIFKNPDRSTVATLRKIAKAMGVKLIELLDG